MRNTLSKQLILLLTTVFFVEVAFIGLAAVIGQSFLKKMQEDELQTYVTSLPPLVSQSLILQKINGNSEAFEFLIYEIIQTRKLNYAGFFLEDELKNRVNADKRYGSCEKFLSSNYCNPVDSDLVFGTTRLEFEGRLIGYVLQEASRSRFTSHLDPAVVVNLGLSLVVAFILNIIAVLFFFRTKVSKNLDGIRKLIDGFNQEKDLPDELNGKINLSEFEEIAKTLKVAHEIRRENLRSRDMKIQSDTLMSTVQMIAHDVRRPFSLLSVSLDALTSMANLTELKVQLLRLKGEVTSSTALVNSMLEDLLEVGRKSIDKLTDVNILTVLNHSIAEVSRIHNDPEIPIVWDVAGNAWVLGEKQRLSRVITNIIANAVEATDAVMQLKLKIFPTRFEGKDMVALDITNTKSFIDVGEREKIFDFFHSKGKSAGTGLGLTIARRIVENHGGTIYCSAEDQGPSTTFHILLPIGVGDALVIDLPNRFSDATLISSGSFVESGSGGGIGKELNALQNFVAREKRKAAVVLIDDDIFYREFCSQLLTSHPLIGGLVEIQSLDAVDDLDRSVLPHLDILLCDLNFGSDSNLGDGALAALRDRFPQAAILLHSDDEWRGRELEKAGYIFFPKPLDAVKFLQAVISINTENGA